MKRTFKSEDDRKTKVFNAWILCMRERTAGAWPDRFTEIYEGSGILIGRTKNKHIFELENGRKIRPVELDPRVSQHLESEDHFHFIVGRKERKWVIIEIQAVLSAVNGGPGQSGIHMTVNPLMTIVPADAPEEFAQVH